MANVIKTSPCIGRITLATKWLTSRVMSQSAVNAWHQRIIPYHVEPYFWRTWIHQAVFPLQSIPIMMTSSNGNIFRVTGPLCGEFTGRGEFPTQRPVTRSFGVFFDLRLNKRLSKQPWGWWFETPSWSLWRQCNDVATFAWSASRMSDLTDLAPTNGTDFALKFYWLSMLPFVTMMTSQRALWPTWYKIWKQNIEHFTDTIVTMWVAKDAVDAEHFGQQWRYFHPFHGRRAMPLFCKSVS